MKTLKISDQVHKELKIFTAKNNLNLTPFCDYLIIDSLKQRNHVFSVKPDKLFIAVKPKSKKP